MRKKSSSNGVKEPHNRGFSEPALLRFSGPDSVPVRVFSVGALCQEQDCCVCLYHLLWREILVANLDLLLRQCSKGLDDIG